MTLQVRRRPSSAWGPGSAWGLAAIVLATGLAQAAEGDEAQPQRARAMVILRGNVVPDAAPEADPEPANREPLNREAEERDRVGQKQDPAAIRKAQIEQAVRQQAGHFERMIAPVLAVELECARRFCGSLTAEDRVAVVAEGQRGVRELAERLVRGQFGMNRAAGGPVEVRLIVRETVVRALEPRANPEEFAAYVGDTRLREERRAAAARLGAVASLDDQLGLTSLQRRALLDDLEANWQPGWTRAVENSRDLTIEDAPPAPDFAAAWIEPRLDQDQQTRWAAWRKKAGSQAPAVRARLDVNWSELNNLQQGQHTIHGWWRP